MTSNNIEIIKRSRYLSTEQAAERIGVSPSTLRGWRRQGVGPAYRKHGKLAKYDVRDLDEWSEAQRVLPGEPSDDEAA